MKLERRDFLTAAGSSVLLLLVGCRLGGEADDATTIVPPTTAPLARPTPTPLPRQTLITAVDDFYVMTIDDTPAVDRTAWSLTIDGLVDNPLQLTFDDLLARPRAELMRTLECIGNPVGGDQIGNAVWAGVWLDDLLAEVGLQPPARRARFRAADGYDTSVALDWITQPGVLLAHEMNGRPLTADHGYPLRIFMPGLYGQKMPKWLTGIEFIASEGHRGDWEDLGWSNVAAVKTNSQIWAPGHIDQLRPGETTIFGVAYAGDRAITRVEIGVEVNDGRSAGPHWFDADLLPGPSPQVWTQFYAAWTPPGDGVYTLLVRATDETGFTQQERARGILKGAFPDGTDKIHNLIVKVGV